MAYPIGLHTQYSKMRLHRYFFFWGGEYGRFQSFTMVEFFTRKHPYHSMDTDRSGFIIYAMYAMVSLDTRGSFSTSTVSVVHKYHSTGPGSTVLVQW